MPYRRLAAPFRECYIGAVTETRSTLLQRLRGTPDDEAWNEFYRLYEPLLSRYVQSRGIAATDAGDVVQEIFTRLVTSMRTFELDRSRGRFRTYLWRVTHNAIADWARRRSRRQAAEDRWQEQMETARRAAESEPEQEWDDQCRRRVLEFSLLAVRQQANVRTWTCFEEHVLKQRSGAEVAEELGMKVGTVYVNASRLMERVKARSAEYLEDLYGEDA